MKEVVAWMFGVGMATNALLFVPQALAIWRTGRSDNVSLVTFGGFNLLQAIGIAHGVLQGDRPLAIGMAVSLLTCGSVTVLALLSRRRRQAA